MPRSPRRSRPPDTAAALSGAAGLLAAAALVSAAGAPAVRVVVSATDITIQVPPDAGDQPTRAAAVAAYAHVLHTDVTARHARGTQTWLEACGRLGAHHVRVWTVTDPTREP